MPLSISIDPELGASGAGTALVSESPVSLLRDYAESMSSASSLSHTVRPRMNGFSSRVCSVPPALSTISEHPYPQPPSPHRVQRASSVSFSARPPILLALIHLLLVAIASSSAVSHRPFVDVASAASIDEHGQLVLASHLYSPLCTKLTYQPAAALHATIAHLVCLSAALGFHLLGWLLLAGSMLAVVDCVRRGGCGCGHLHFCQRLSWCVVFGWTALYALKCRTVKKVDDKMV